jgi:hypothetical protein
MCTPANSDSDPNVAVKSKSDGLRSVDVRPIVKVCGAGTLTSVVGWKSKSNPFRDGRLMLSSSAVNPVVRPLTVHPVLSNAGLKFSRRSRNVRSSPVRSIVTSTVARLVLAVEQFRGGRVDHRGTLQGQGGRPARGFAYPKHHGRRKRPDARKE